MRTLLVCALLVPTITLGAPRKVTVPAERQAADEKVEKTGAKPTHPHVDKGPSAARAKAKRKAVEAPAKP